MIQHQTRPIKPAVDHISSWTIQDFKAISYATLPLQGLVLLAGANSSGKSSLLQSMLLVSQSADQEIQLNGNLVRLGAPKDVVRDRASSVVVGCNAVLHGDGEANEWNVQLTLRPKRGGLRVAHCLITREDLVVLEATDDRVTDSTDDQIDPGSKHGDSLLRVREIDSKKAPSHTYVKFNGLSPTALFVKMDKALALRDLRRGFTLKTLQESTSTSTSLLTLLLNTFSTKHEIFSNKASRSTINKLLDYEQQMESSDSLISRAELDRLLLAVASQWQEGSWQPVPIKNPPPRNAKAESPSLSPLRLPTYWAAHEALKMSTGLFEAIAKRTRYLGPLREEPQVLAKNGVRSQTSPVGIRGELTAEALSRGSNLVEYFDWNGDFKSTHLIDAVSLWTSYLGLGQKIAVEDLGKLGRGLRININGAVRDLTMVGVGASQLLPVITAVLDAPKGTTILLEQPELHLHPSVQSRLGDFLVFARPDLNIVVETHSEYLITRIRLRVAKKNIRPDHVHVLFTESFDGETEVRELRMNNFGNLDEWPRGFFDTHDTDANEIIRAIATRNRSK